MELKINDSWIWDHNKPTCIDIEDNEQGEFVGIGVSQDGVHVSYFTTLEPMLQTLLENVQLIGHNIKYDIHQLSGWGVNIMAGQILHDTKLMAHILDVHDTELKSIAKRYLGMEWTTYKELVTGKGKKRLTLDKHPVEEVANYCASDVIATYKLHEKLLGIMRPEEKSYYATDRILQQLTFQMEQKGVKVDREHLQKILIEQEALLEDRRQVFDMAGINPNSPKQLLPFLQKSIPGLKATNEKAVSKFTDTPIVASLLSYRGTQKVVSTYIKPLLSESVDGRVHGEFKLTGTVTGRFSSANPNLQNQPKGELIRTAFIPETNETWYKFDYSQLELRVLAHLSKDPALMEAFNGDKDLHTYTASKIFKIPEAEVTEEQRFKGKTINFSIGYGTTEFGLAAQLNCSLGEAETWIEEWWSTYIGAYAYRTRVVYRARQKGYIETLFGIRRPIKGINDWCGCRKKYCKQCWRDKAIVRELMSAQVQGSSADIVRKAMADCGSKGYVPLIQVHDELDLSFREDAKSVEEIKRMMETTVKLVVPLVVDIKKGKNWGECG